MSASKMMLFFCIACGLLLALLPHIFWFVGFIISKIFRFQITYRPFGLSALGLVLIFWSVMAYGYFVGRWKLQTVEMEYSHADVPEAFDGFKIVHISDLHLSTFDDSPEKLETFIDEINRHSPDLICFTGDMVTIGKKEAEPYTAVLKSMTARHGVMSVLGNHDFMIYGFNDEAEREEMVSEFADYQTSSLGWKLLRNTSVKIVADDGSAITIIGVDNCNSSYQGFKTIDNGDLKMAMAGTDGFRILLSHDPSHWSSEVVPETDIPLTLSGHTHCAQVRIFGWTPAKVSFVETDGRYDRDGQTLYINIGLGCTAPFRLGANPEITVITLRSEASLQE